MSLTAFVGVGFDASVAKLKLGINGKISVNTNFLYLKEFSGKDSNGTKLDLNGEIGIRLEAKVWPAEYNKTFASTSFKWKGKTWGAYDAIKQKWASTG